MVQSTTWKKTDLTAPFLAIVLLAVTLLLYIPVLNNGFVNYDDPLYVSENTIVQNGLTFAGIRWALTAFAASNWHPLTWLSHMLDVQLYGMHPLGHHLTSILVHGAVTLLLFLFLHRATRTTWRSFLVALLFGIHPLHVESVAWIAERKDVLCGLFWMLTLLAYERYVNSGSRRAYLSAVGWYAAAVLSKPMAVTLPLILFILDYWPFGRIGIKVAITSGHSSPSSRVVSLILEKLPFFLLAAVSVVFTVIAQNQAGSIKVTTSWWENLTNAVVAYGTYLVKFVWPGKMVVLYPYVTQPLWRVLLAAVIIVAISITFWQWRDRRFLLAGWFWYLITLLPVSGIIRIGEHSIADRYAYLPLIGPLIMVCWGIGAVPVTTQTVKNIFVAMGCTILLFYSVLTWKQTLFWYDSVVLFQHATDNTKNNWMACHNLGLAFMARWEPAEGLKWLQQSVTINPSNPIAYNSLGIAYGQLGFTDKATEALKEAVRLDPGLVDARYNLVRAYIEQGKRDAAFSEYQQLWKIDRKLADTLQPNFLN